jgi:hypothetical protein
MNWLTRATSISLSIIPSRELVLTTPQEEVGRRVTWLGWGGS